MKQWIYKVYYTVFMYISIIFMCAVLSNGQIFYFLFFPSCGGDEMKNKRTGENIMKIGKERRNTLKIGKKEPDEMDKIKKGGVERVFQEMILKFLLYNILLSL